MYSIMCSNTEDVDKHRINSELYTALLLAEDEKKVIELCRKVSDHALHMLTIHDDTIIHMATYSKKSELVLTLLDELPEQYHDKITRQNQAGQTILHQTATSNHALPVAEKVLKKAPGLLGMRNNNGETALFQSARYGKTEIFNFLAGKISSYDHTSKLPFLQRSDKTTVLHMSILALHFDLALQIAKDYKYLINEQDGDGMTALQLLALTPKAFHHRRDHYGFCFKLNDNLGWREKVRKEEEEYKSVMELAELLIQNDKSWELTFPIQDQSRPIIHKYGTDYNGSLNEKTSGSEMSTIDHPLFLAAKSGCTEIVKLILKIYPQAVEHINMEGRNILHVAIRYRQSDIFEHVKNMDAPMRRLVRKIDNKGNTILHMAAGKIKDYVPERMDGPALELQGEILWFERVKDVILPHFMTHRNYEKLTAEAYFAASNNELRVLAKEWLRHTAEGCTVVAVLIATVAFAAAYTVPGGSDESTGFPVLINQPFFVVFTISDVLSLTLSLASVVTFLSILSSPFRLQDFRHSLPNKLTLGSTFLFLSVVMMMVAFAATILLMIKKKENWPKIMLYTFSFIPVGVFALSYFPVYIKKSIQTGCHSLFKKTKHIIPRSFLAFFNYISCVSICCRAPTSSSYIP